MVLFGSQTPIPTPSMTVDPNSVTPGPAGFAVMIFIVIALIALIWDMNRRVRRVRYRGEVRADLDAEQSAAQAQTDAAAADDGAPTAGDDSGDTRPEEKNPPG